MSRRPPNTVVPLVHVLEQVLDGPEAPHELDVDVGVELGPEPLAVGDDPAVVQRHLAPARPLLRDGAPVVRPRVHGSALLVQARLGHERLGVLLAAPAGAPRVQHARRLGVQHAAGPVHHVARDVGVGLRLRDGVGDARGDEGVDLSGRLRVVLGREDDEDVGVGGSYSYIRRICELSGQPRKKRFIFKLMIYELKKESRKISVWDDIRSST